jgi:gamma-glutamyl phosphate reductase
MQLEINKKTQIAWIIETRKPLIDQISLKQQYLLHMSDAIRAIEALQEPILQSGEATLIEMMKEIDLPATEPERSFSRCYP